VDFEGKTSVADKWIDWRHEWFDFHVFDGSQEKFFEARVVESSARTTPLVGAIVRVDLCAARVVMSG
jgi:hypothetical protein